LHSLLFLLCFYNGCYAQSGIQLSMTQEGLDTLEKIVSPFVLGYLSAKEPIVLPDQTIPIPALGNINITDLSVFALNYQNLDLEYVDNGVQATMSGLAFHLSYDAIFNIIGFSNSLAGNATINNTDVIIVFNVTSEQGKPQISILDNKLLIGTLDTGLTGLLGFVASALEFAIKDILDDEIPSFVDESIVPELNGILANLSMTTYLDANNLTVLDYSLAESPYVHENALVVNIKGDIHPSNETSCSLTPNPFEKVVNRSIQLLVNEYVIDCALLAFQSTGVLSQIINQQLQNKLTFDGHILSVFFLTIFS